MSGLSPPGPTGSATGNPRNKTALKPGRSLMDWVRLGHSGADLTGTKGTLLDVTPQELAKHNKRNDSWMALRGKVYNVTPYMEFHPGGEEELMKGAGKDATDLFNEVHKWVNFEGMLQKCLVGRLVMQTRPFFLKPSFLPLGRTPSKAANTATQKSSLSVTSLAPPAAPSAKSPVASPLTPSALPSPKYDWFQTNTLINLAVYTRWKHITRHYVVVMKKDAEVKVVCYIQEMVYMVHLELDKPVSGEFEVRTGGSSGKVDVLLPKQQPGVRWSRVGKTLPGHGSHLKAKDAQIEYIECSLSSSTAVTHNTLLMQLQVPDETYLPVPVGYHVYLKLPGQDAVKPYTPVAPVLSLSTGQQEIGRTIHLFIKVYSDGALTPALKALPVGSSVQVSLPEGTFTQDKLTAATCTASCLVLLAAGTGITPMLRLMLAALTNNKNVHLILFNKTEEDIPWREELESLREDSNSLLKVSHVLSEGSDSWAGPRGRISKELLETLLPELSEDDKTYLCMCGPLAFTKLAVSVLDDLGYSKEEYHAFLG